MFKKFMLSIAFVSAVVGMSIEVAEAKRLGGGRNTGIQRTAPMQRQTTPPTATPQQQAAPTQAARPASQPAPAAQPSGWRKWGGALAGLAAGIGLAALLSHFGLGGEFAGLLLLIVGAIVVFALLRRFMGGARTQQAEPAYAGAGNVSPMQREAGPQAAVEGGSATPAADSRFPAGFDAAAFERQAKLNFIRLQAANDAGNLADIRDFTSPEIFAEIKLGIDERGGKVQKTDVVVLNAEVLEVAEENAQYIASVHYSGSLREDDAGAPQAFNEVWHLVKPVDGNRGWTLAGIQQVS